MPEVLLNPIVLKSNATASSTARRIFYGKNNLDATAGLNVKVQLIQKADSFLNSSSKVNGRIVKIVKSKSSVVGTASIPPTTSRLIKYVKTSLSTKTNVISKMHKYKTVKSHLISRATLETYIYVRDIRESMMGYLPPFYQDIKDFNLLIAAEANEFTRLNAKLDELLLQFNVGTATYSLDDWERFTKAKSRRSLSARRSEVMKRIVGPGTVTPVVLKAIVDDYYVSDMDEVLRPGIIEFKFKKRGRLEGVPEIHEEVNEVIPRHLEPVFSFTFMPWRELDMIRQSWTDVSEFKMAEIEVIHWREFEGMGAKWRQVKNMTAEQLEASYDLNKGGTTE